MLANCLFSIGIQSVRLTSNVRGIGARLEQNSMGLSRGGGVVSDAFGRLESFWQAVGGSFLGGWLVVENASKLSFF